MSYTPCASHMLRVVLMGVIVGRLDTTVSGDDVYIVGFVRKYEAQTKLVQERLRLEKKNEAVFFFFA